jgi:hypothetical protein
MRPTTIAIVIGMMINVKQNRDANVKPRLTAAISETKAINNPIGSGIRFSKAAIDLGRGQPHCSTALLGCVWSGC